MRHYRCFSFAPLLVGVFVVTLMTPGSVAAQATSAGSGEGASLRTAWGDPDLEGVWNYSTLTPLQRPSVFGDKAVLTEEEAAAYQQRLLASNDKDRRDFDPGTTSDVARAYNEFWWDRGTEILPDRRTSLVTDPPDGRIPPYTQEALDRAATLAVIFGRINAGALPGGVRPEGVADGTQGGVDGRGGRADGPEDRDVGDRCITRVLPRFPGAYNNNYQIVQSPEHVAILAEMNHDVRIIPLDGRPHIPQDVDQWLGDSRGRWEGDRLVVETINFTPKQEEFRGASEQMRMVERFTRVDAQTVHYEVTIEDPATWAKPWTVEFPFQRTQDQVYEYACHEGNYGLLGILSGTRAHEQAQEAGKTKTR